MSTAEEAGRPVGPPWPPLAPPVAPRTPTAVPRGAGAPTVARCAGWPTATPAPSSAPTTPVPVTRARGAHRTGHRRRRLRLAASGSGRRRGSAPGPAGARRAAPRQAPRPASARRVRLTVSRVDPWSAMKIAFLLSVALGIAGVVMVFVLWTILAGMGVFDQINGIVGQVVQDGQQRFDIMDFVGLGRVRLAVDRHRRDRRDPGDRDRDPRRVPLQRVERPGRRRAAHPHRRLTCAVRASSGIRAVLSAGAVVG